jgi:glyoxalase family protein
VRLWERELAPTERFLTDGLGLTRVAEENGWVRMTSPGASSGAHLEIRALAGVDRGMWGTGSVHHVAWRVPDEGAQREARRTVIRAGGSPTEVIDRFWFKSIYFKEPGGALFEIATDGPGFGVDEAMESLGERLILPPWLEPNREAIEAGLPPLPG